MRFFSGCRGSGSGLVEEELRLGLRMGAAGESGSGSGSTPKSNRATHAQHQFDKLISAIDVIELRSEYSKYSYCLLSRSSRSCQLGRAEFLIEKGDYATTMLGLEI